MLIVSFLCAADIISTVEFDHTGDYLATGDKGGRVVLFERFEGVIPPVFCNGGLTFTRRKDASTNSTMNSNRMNQSSTTSNP